MIAQIHRSLGENPEPSEIIAALDTLVVSEGWRIILRVLKGNVAYLEEAIITKREPGATEDLTDEEVDRLRYKRELNLDVMNTPESYRAELERKNAPVENFDPYHDNIEEAEKYDHSQ